MSATESHSAGRTPVHETFPASAAPCVGLSHPVDEASGPRTQAHYAASTHGFFDIVAVCFVAFLLLSNIGATKLIGVHLGPLALVFDGGAILFPLTYILGDVLSEVYGFKAARRVILTGFVVQLIASLTFWLVQIAPVGPDYTSQEAFEAVLGVVPRFVAASIIGYIAGQLLNSYVLVRIKDRFGEKRLWVRLLTSTLVGEAVDTILYCTIAWVGVAGFGTIANLTITGYVYKVGVEALFLPLTYQVVGWFKRHESSYATGARKTADEAGADDAGSGSAGGAVAAVSNADELARVTAGDNRSKVRSGVGRAPRARSAHANTVTLRRHAG
ncbi:hypothetical protein DDD63_11475 [Actinobaculum sp. 313]|nr:hypothetical protein DDD63_11475 [Actinobaculum sp. 313]